MAPKKKAKVEEELDELEDLEDLEEEEPEEEDEDESEDDEDEDEDEDEDSDEEDEAPKKKSSKKKAKVRDDGKIGTKELADALGTSGRELRVMLRQKKVGKNENNRYEWDSVEEAIGEMGFKTIKAAQKGLADSRAKRLTELKDRVAASKKKKSSKKSKKAPVEDDDDEDEDDE